MCQLILVYLPFRLKYEPKSLSKPQIITAEKAIILK